VFDDLPQGLNDSAVETDRCVRKGRFSLEPVTFDYLVDILVLTLVIPFVV
jgi:hypothetical protein